MAVRDEVRDAQRALATLDAAHRRAVARLDQALARRGEALAETDRQVAAARGGVEAAVQPAAVARDRQGLAVFLPSLGTATLGSVSPADIQAAVDRRARQASPATVTRDFAALRAMLNSAVDADLIGRSPARKVALPRIIRPERRTRTPEQLHKLVDEVPGHYHTLVLTSGVLGRAWEEVIALRVRDVDFARRTITVAQTVEELAGHLAIVPEGKRPARLRTMAVPTFLLDHIGRHLSTYRAAVTGDPDALIFVGPKGGVLRRRFGERILRPATVRADLDGLTFHGLRHAATSSLVDVGVHPRVMAARIGHGTVKTTMEVYARASNSADHEAAALLQQRFAEAFAEGLQVDPGVTQT
ncbi:MAG: tyrosine-type recombinase/integrase [Actinomycetota bacterium]|nr:tyrosine-type recombinase/integrase [Actinomycetota bacterium]